jgi:hypothetical protein
MANRFGGLFSLEKTQIDDMPDVSKNAVIQRIETLPKNQKSRERKSACRDTREVVCDDFSVQELGLSQ